MKNTKFLQLTSLLVLLQVFAVTSCREEFGSEFREVPIINNAPKVSSEIGEVQVPEGGERELDLSRFITDVEGDAISYSVVSSNSDIATVTVAGSLVTITGVSLGRTTISVDGNDGTPGNDVSTDFTVSVVGSLGPQAVFSANFDDVANGTDVNDIEWPDGASAVWEGDPGASGTVERGVIEITMGEYYGMNLSFEEAIDVSENPLLQFDYANAWNGEAYFIVFSEGGDSQEISFEADFADQLIPNRPGFNTYTIDLSTLGVDVTAITGFYLEKAGGPGSWQMDNIVLGPPKDPAVFSFDFESVADGTDVNDIEWPNGASATWEGDPEATGVVNFGVIEITMGEYYGMNLSFEEAIDVSENPLLQFDYANAWNGEAYFIAFSEGGDSQEISFEADFTDQLIPNNPEFNTYTIDLSTLGIDVSAVTGFYLEKAGGPGAWEMDNIVLGPSE